MRVGRHAGSLACLVLCCAGIALAAPGQASAAPGRARAAAAGTMAPAAGAATAGTGTCAKNALGRLVGCPRPVGSGRLPPGARDTAPVMKPVPDPAPLVDTRTWTSSGGNTFPGADVPFGMVQWSPDTLPDRSDGGGYTYGNHLLYGYSLTHLSGPGCRSGGDIPILPMTGRLTARNPLMVRTSFTNSGEVAQAGYYSARSDMPHTVTSQFSATPHTAMGRFTFPRTRAADFLVKLKGSQRGDVASSALVINDHEVAGSATTGDFCGETSRFGRQRYTVYFDLLFNHSFTAHRVIRVGGRSDPNSIFLTFDTVRSPVIEVRAAISYVSIGNARLDRGSQAPGWDFGRVRRLAQRRWNTLLGRIEVSGGSYARTQEFYSLLYKDFIQPNITSDVNGQYRGADGLVHRLSRGQGAEYGIFSGWDIYHSLAQLQAMLDPGAASDMAQSLVNDYAQNGILPQWGYLNLDNYIMTGDPSDAVIADYYAFGARGFDAPAALAAMLEQADTVNRVRPGAALEARYSYLPYGARYGCCNFRDPVSELLEYDTADFALSRFAAALGDAADAARLASRADNWVNVFSRARRLLVPRRAGGAFLAGIRPTTIRYYTEGDAAQYLWDVPNDYAGLIARLGGRSRAASWLRGYLSQPNAGGQHALITNEFDDGEQFAPDYSGDPATAQRAVALIRQTVYRPGPDGIRNNDDLGAESSQFIWETLGMYPENPGSGTLVFASPGFPRTVIRLPGGRKVTISAPGASASRFYVSALTIDGKRYSRLFVPFSRLALGARLDWRLSTRPTAWGGRPGDAPPSYPRPAAPGPRVVHQARRARAAR